MSNKINTDKDLLFQTDFVFNTMNTIYQLVDTNTKLSKEMILNLSGLLRCYFYDSKVDSILLSQECRYIEQYLKIEEKRKEDLLISFNLDTTYNCKIKAGMLLYLTQILTGLSHNICSPAMKINIRYSYQDFFVFESTILKNPLSNNLKKILDVKTELEKIYHLNNSFDFENSNQNIKIKILFKHLG